jgi:Amt family ammonium transporter
MNSAWIAALILLCAGTASAAPDVTALKASLDEQSARIDQLWVLIAACLVFVMQAGFLCFEVGSVRRKTVKSVAVKNGADWIVCALAFFLLGFGLMFGHSAGGIVGTDLFMGVGLEQANEVVPFPTIFFLFQLGFAATAVTIVSGAMAGRAGLVSYLVTSFFVALIVYPLFGHAVWGGTLFAGEEGWLASLGFVDFAGSTVVHSAGAWVALAGVWIVGPRLGRFKRDGSVKPMKSYSAAFQYLGVLFLGAGWWGFNGGSTLALNESVGPIILNTMLAAAGGGLASFSHCWFAQAKRDLNAKLVGGLLGGFVAITACCHAVNPIASLLIGLVAGVVHNVGYDFLLYRMRLDDPVGVVPVHGFCGVWGTLAFALFADAEMLAHGRAVQFGVQLLGVVTCLVWAGTTGYACFKLIERVFGLRVSPEEEAAGIDLSGDVVVESRPDPVDEDLLRRLMPASGGE